MQPNLHTTKLATSIFYCLFILMGSVANAQTKTIIGYVNHQPVEQAELDREIANHKAETMNMLTQKYHLNDLSNFWSKKFEGVKASDILKKTAWAALVKAKVQEQLFSSQKLWPFKNTEDLKAEMEKVNANRRKQKSAGKVIYGPVTFSEKTFYDYEFSNAIIKVKDKLFPKPVAENLLLAHFKKMKNTVYANSNYEFEKVKSRVETSFIDAAYERLVARKVKAAQVSIE